MKKDSLLRRFREIAASPRITGGQATELQRLLEEVKWKHPELESLDEVKTAKSMFRKMVRAGMVRWKKSPIVRGGSPGLGRRN